MRKLLTISIVMLAVCTPAMAQEPPDLLAIADAADKALNAHDMDQWLSYFTEDGVVDLVTLPAPLDTRDKIKAFFGDQFAGSPDWHTTESRVLTVGNLIVVEHAAAGTNTGDSSLGPATGNSWTFPHLDIYEFEGDKIKKLTTYGDYASTFIQLGLLPVPDMPPLVPTYALPEPEPTGLSPWDADVQLNLRWNTHDLPDYAKRYRSDALIFAAPLGSTVGRNEWIALAELIFQGFSGQSHIIRRVDMGDGFILTEFQNRATHNGPYMGIPASGNSTNLKSVSLIQYDADGLVAAGSYYYDELTLITQITAPPAPQP